MLLTAKFTVYKKKDYVSVCLDCKSLSIIMLLLHEDSSLDVMCSSVVISFENCFV